jgi:Transcriptional regulator, AbiEi antitoxin, Type IV TA system/Transcriptional regulator, AbiEi antitoxin N-terminal domain
MAEQKPNKSNWLERNLPEGLVVDASWLTKHDYSTSLRSQYVAAGRLEQPARGVYRRPRGSLTWQQVVISLQTILEQSLVVGGRTALELQGYAHYLPSQTKEVHLYGPKRPPGWLKKLRLSTRFVYHNGQKLFRMEASTRGLADLKWTADEGKNGRPEALHDNLVVKPWGHWDWPLTLSSPERAILELLDELPSHETFHQADMLMEGMATLSPRRLQKLLEDCRSVKVKRLFLFFADRHPHAWVKRLDKDAINLGTGKRMLVKGGKLNKAYQITVPEEMDAVP